VTKQLIPTGESSGRFDPFRLLDAAERRRHLSAYRSFLEARNGRIDLKGRSLTCREQFFRALRESPVVSRNLGDRSGFRDRMRGSGSVAIDQATAWLVAVAKASEGECYGVDLELAKYDRDERYAHATQYLDPEGADEEVAQLYAFMEELYHGRLLTEMCTTLGHEFDRDPPHWRMRLLIHLINRTPNRCRWVLVHCAEIVGSTCFELFLERCSLFADEPEVEARLRWLVGEIWRDEVLHVALVRARLGPVGMWFARRLFPLVLGFLLRDVPELFEIGCERDAFMERLRSGIEIPADIDWLSPDSLPA
jgi:hypothetical protein